MNPSSLDRRLAYVIPAFNEGEMLSRVIEELRREAPPGLILVVDDASVDDTGAVAARAGAQVIRHPINRGQGMLGAEVVITFDADGQHDPLDVRRLLESLMAADSDVALGSRFLSPNQIPWLRKIVLRLGVAFTRIVSRLSITDTHNGLRAIRASALKSLRLKEDRMAHASELLDLISASKLKFVEVPCTIRYSAYSRGKGQRSSAAPRVAIEFLFGKLMR